MTLILGVGTLVLRSARRLVMVHIILKWSGYESWTLYFTYDLLRTWELRSAPDLIRLTFEPSSFKIFQSLEVKDPPPPQFF